MTYSDTVEEFRRRKDEHFAAGHGPVRPEAFEGLTYYPPDPAWRFEALLEPCPSGDPAFVLETNTGEERVMARVGTVTVNLPGGSRTLLAFAPLNESSPQRVFVPFRDATSGTETYPAGRYLDVPLTRDADSSSVTAQVDFNLAYHPYCAYSPAWTCPLPPPENRLEEMIRAGERLSIS